ncbi:hypothetical protein [Lentibacillus sp. CBA3610]|nr:hypothetical protein [Lentibacillus sp. CBA3610]
MLTATIIISITSMIISLSTLVIVYQIRWQRNKKVNVTRWLT